MARLLQLLGHRGSGAHLGVGWGGLEGGSRLRGEGAGLTALPLRVFTEPQYGATYDQLLAAARVTQECGFDAFFRSDHYLRTGGEIAGSGHPGPTDAWATLAGPAVQNSRNR